MFRRSLLSFAVILASGHSAYAGVITTNETQKPIVVTATRTAQIADETLAPVIVITREDIDRMQAQDVADLLRFNAGLDIGRNGGPGQVTSLFIRGTNSNHALIMMDGVKINPATIGGAAIQDIDPAIIERIEIVKGPRSALYGSEAVGGVVNIITRKATRDRAAVGLRGGNYNTKHLSLDAHHAGQNLRAGITASRLATDGFPTLSGTALDRGYDNTTVNVYAGTRTGGVDMELSHWQAAGRTEYLDSFTKDPLDQDYKNSVSALTLKANPVEQWATTLKLSQMANEIDQNQSADYAHTKRSVLDWQNDLPWSDQQMFTAGLWLSHEKADASVYGTVFDKGNNVNAVFVQDDINFDAHHVLLAVRDTRHESFGNHTTWDAEYGYRWSEQTRFTAAMGTAFRAPDNTDRFGYGGNPNLGPETSRNLEIGLHHQLNEHQSMALSAFDNHIKDLIEYNLTTSGMVNSGRARIRGIEAGYTLTAAPWGAKISAIVQDPKNEDSGEPLARRAKRSATASLFYDNGHYLLGADLLAAGRRKDSAYSTSNNAGYGLVNLAAQARFGKKCLAGIKVENALDQHYELANGYNTAGQSWYAELRYDTDGR